MRNPLARLARRDPTKPTLRERLAATKAKARQVLAVNRVLLKTPQSVAPAVDRIALVNYATWLDFERTNVCAELYPHMGGRAARFVLTNNAAVRFFYPENSFNDLRSKAWRDVPPASTRALKVLDLVGVNWREDTDAEARADLDSPARRDNGDRPKLPHGWPRLDADLTAAISDMLRLDAAIAGIKGSDGREFDEMPEYGPLEEARGEAIGTLIHTGAVGLLGLQSKAKAILTDLLPDDDGWEIAQSLARDLLGASQSFLEPRPDPIHAALAECERLEAECGALDRRDAANAAVKDISPETEAAADAVWIYFRGTVLKTHPTTGRGCAALARFVGGFYQRWASSIDEDAPAILGLIAKSPML